MATIAPKSGPGDMTTFNILHGFAEALVRGMRNSFLADSDYHHLTQCESLEDVKLNLTESDYAEALADMGSISPNELQKQAIEKVGGDALTTVIFCFAAEHIAEVQSMVSSRNLFWALRKELCAPISGNAVDGS